MNFIGSIIKEYRCMIKMSRKSLSENICSEKYIYLIEKGERTPSADMVRLFSDRMGVDLFDHYQYLDCIDPISVRKTLKNFDICQRKSDFKTAKNIVDMVMEHQDFKNKPWLYELEANKIGYMVFVENKYEEAIICANHVLEDIEAKYSSSIHVVNLYVLLSTCYQIIGDLRKAKSATLAAYDIVSSKYKIEKYDHDIVSVRLNLVTLYYLTKDYEKAILEGMELIDYQIEHNSYARIHIAYFFLAFTYYKKESFEEAFLYFNQAISVLMAFYNPIDVKYIMAQDVFKEMDIDERVNQKSVREFKIRYGIDKDRKKK